MGVAAAAKNVGLIAGNGKFPLIFAQEAKREGYEVIAVAHRGETVPEIETVADAVTWIYVGQLGKIIRTFQQAGVKQAVMAGGIRKVKLFGNFRPDLRGVSFLARMKSREDDDLLRGIAGELERDGIKIIESTFCLADIMPKIGTLTSHQPNAAQQRDVEIGFAAAKEIGRLGIGQTVVVKDGVIVAVEAIEGTDAAILRGGALAKHGCVVVKVSKPQQDLRFDVPAVGVDTIKSMAQVGAAVLAVEAEKTILIEKEALLAEAQRQGIAVLAVSR